MACVWDIRCFEAGKGNLGLNIKMEVLYMNFELFTEEMRRLIESGLGKGYQVRVKKIVKNNACPFTGLVIHKRGESMGPIVYMEPYYREYMEGSCLRQLAKELVEDYRINEVEQISVNFSSCLLSWDRVKDMILYKVVNTGKNKKMLEEMPHREYLDLSIIYYIYLGNHSAGQFTVPVSTGHMELWKVTEEDLYRAAIKNTPLLMPAVIKTMEDVLSELIRGEFGEVINDTVVNAMFENISDSPILYICSNNVGMNGAACILYEGVLAEFAERMGSDVIILPSSIHETILLPDRDEMDYNDMRDMVKSINENDVPDEDVLSDRVYRYSLEKREVEVVG